MYVLNLENAVILIFIHVRNEYENSVFIGIKSFLCQLILIFLEIIVTSLNNFVNFDVFAGYNRTI